MTEDVPGQGIAVFWDFENVHDIEATHAELTRHIQSSGKVVKAYAFADFDPHRRMAENLHQLGYDLIHVPDERDNAADYKMASYIVDHMVHYPETGLFVMITGDGDFKLTAGTVRERGFDLWIISNPIITSADLTRIATTYYDIYSFRPTTLDCTRPEDCDVEKGSTKESRHLAAVHMQDAIRAILDAGNKPGIGHVKHVLKSLKPDFNEGALGFANWNAFIDWAEEHNYVQRVGELPTTVLEIPEDSPDEAAKTSDEFRDAFDMLVKVLEHRLEENQSTRLDVIKSILDERGFEPNEFGYPKLTDFILSAEKRGLLRVIPSEDGGQPTILPVCDIDMIRGWFERNVKDIFGASVNVPKDVYLEKVRTMLIEYQTTMKKVEKYLKDEDVKKVYSDILEASDVPFLPPYQMSLAHVLIGQGHTCEETVERVNEELKPVAITLQCPEEIGE